MADFVVDCYKESRSAMSEVKQMLVSDAHFNVFVTLPDL